MQSLYAPWRDKYIMDENKSKKNGNCVFCDITNIKNSPQEDKEKYIVYKDKYLTVVMNTYPYSNGHILILPNEHQPKPSMLKKEVWLEMSNKTSQFVEILESYGAQAVNVGININKEAGAGIPEHLHIHLVPRWEGDSNFMSVIAGARVISRDFNSTYEEIVKLSSEYLECNK